MEKYRCLYTSMGLYSFGLESLDTWFRTLYLVYGLGLGTPKLISCRVELRRALRLLDMCFGKGSSYKLNPKKLTIFYLMQ